MTIAMQGTWIVSIKSEHAGWPQRFRIEGSTNGKDGTYPETSAPVLVTGSQWGVTIEHNPPGSAPWTPSRERLANFRTQSGQFLFDIKSDDTAGDEDFNDLVLTCSMPLSSSDYVVYGTAKSYSGWCWYNPCYPLYVVIETLDQLDHLLQFRPARELLEKLYPERVKPHLKRPFPEPDPAPFKPMLIPTGRTGSPGFDVRGRTEFEEIPVKKGASKKSAPSIHIHEETTLELVVDRPQIAMSPDDLRVAAGILDRLRVKPCTVKPISQTLLRFVEYDRTEGEKLGDPYTGEGGRTTLGQTATDEQGNYVFRFSWSLADIADETTDIAAGEDVATQLRPDLLVQVMETLPDGVAWESAPYYNVPNVRRINLCIPESSTPTPAACQGGRAIQAIGNLFIVPHAGTTLHTDGTISNTSATGPLVEHAAWRGRLDLFACFIDFRDGADNPEIEYYTIRYRRQLAGVWESGWHFVNEHYTHLEQQGDGTWKSSLVGPMPRTLEIDGVMTAIDQAYLCIEEKPGWLFTHRDRKVQLSTGLYQSEAGPVEFKIEGYDATGAKITGAEDTVRLYLDNAPSSGAVDYVKFGTGQAEECAFYELPDADSALDVRYKAIDEQGFMRNYSLVAYRGSNTSVPIVDTLTLTPIAAAYQDVAPYRFGGTLDVSLDGWVEIQVQPASGNWLPAGRDFCAFSFELYVRDRTTNGYGTPGNRLVYRELIGLAHDDGGGA
jgi:hypothetical protein